MYYIRVECDIETNSYSDVYANSSFMNYLFNFSGGNFFFHLFLRIGHRGLHILKLEEV